MDTLPVIARRAALNWPDAVALVFDTTGEVLTFAEVDQRTDAIAFGLISAGIEPGDRVMVWSGNIGMFPLAWLGIVKAGAIMVPLNTSYKTNDARHLLALAEPKAAFCDTERTALLDELLTDTPSLSLLIGEDAGGRTGWHDFRDFGGTAAPRVEMPIAAEDDVTNIQFTSGTSGLPKGCMLTHTYWKELAAAVDATVVKLSPQDTVLTAQSFSYLDPQWLFVLTMMSGARLVVLERFRPSLLWERIQHYDVTFFYCLAAMPLMLLSCPESVAERSHRLRAVMCSAIPPDRHVELEERFNVPWLEAYGSTETGSDLGVSWADHDQTVGSGTIGKPLAHREAQIVSEDFVACRDGEVGELAVRGAGVMKGYWRNPDATADVMRDGWYQTGDLARRDADGFFHLVGRRKDMIRRAGENIAAAEVENVLQQHPSVTLAACVAVPDPVRNEEIKAFVVLKRQTNVTELAQFLEDRLARFKIPRYWEFVEDLPMTPSERVAKPQLSRSIEGAVVDRLAVMDPAMGTAS